MEQISVFDMLKIGVGPSSSHTLGPWRAAEKWIQELKDDKCFDQVESISVNLYGSLSLTGKGHATDLACILGLSGTDPEYIPIEDMDTIIEDVKLNNRIQFGGHFFISFNFNKSIVFNSSFLDYHSNGLTFKAILKDGTSTESTFYSIGGGFITKENTANQHVKSDFKRFKFPIQTSKELLNACNIENKSISEIVWINETILRSPEEVDNELHRVWDTMLECMYIGCHTEGILPGGLNVRRRAYNSYQKLKGDCAYQSHTDWIESIRNTEVKFRQIFKWVSTYALAVNEVNAALGRVVTAPTNGSAGVIPAVIMYYLTIENHKADFSQIKEFLLVAGEIGSIFKKGATISAAMGGCQAEIGVSSAMAAAGLCSLLGGSSEQITIAAEIAMEHHLGLTCDPIGGLVQIPCIERNAMGAIKAINAAEMAIDTDPAHVLVPLDKVIETMWETAQDMNRKYKETSEGGLAISVGMASC